MIACRKSKERPQTFFYIVFGKGAVSSACAWTLNPDIVKAFKGQVEQQRGYRVSLADSGENGERERRFVYEYSSSTTPPVRRGWSRWTLNRDSWNTIVCLIEVEETRDASITCSCLQIWVHFSGAEWLHLVMLPITQKLNFGPFLQGNFLQHSIQRSYNEFKCHNSWQQKKTAHICQFLRCASNRSDSHTDRSITTTTTIRCL